jgi:rhodanese-related sulfurtransferase
MKPLLSLAIAGLALLWVSAAPAGDPEVPEKYIKVDEVKALMDLRKRVVPIDVRVKEQFDELHIRGAINIPLRELAGRLAEVPRQDFVVLY